MKSITEYLSEDRHLGEGWKTWQENGFQICMLAFKEKSMYGIDGGRISKLWIKTKGKIYCNYDRGWDIKPTPEVKKLYDQIIKKYN